MERSKLAREFVRVTTEFGDIRVKIGRLGDRIVNIKPEFGDCRRAAKEHDVAVKTVTEAAMKAYSEKK